MSGGFGTTFANRHFILSYNSHAHKIFISSEQADGFVEEHKNEFYSRLSALLPLLTQKIKDASKELFIGEMDFFLNETKYDTTIKFNEIQYPQIISLPLNDHWEGKVGIKIVLNSAPEHKEIRSFIDQIDTLLEKNAAVSAEMLETTAPCRVKVHENYAIYVGTNILTDFQSAEYYEKKFAKILKTVSSQFSEYPHKKFAELGVSFLPLSSVLQSGDINPPFHRFRNYHSAVQQVQDSEASTLRISWMRDNMDVSVLFAVKNYKWEIVWGKVIGWLSEILGEPTYK